MVVSFPDGDGEECTAAEISFTTVGIGLVLGGSWFAYVALRWGQIKELGAEERKKWCTATAILGLTLGLLSVPFLIVGVGCVNSSLLDGEGQECDRGKGPIFTAAGAACLPSMSRHASS